MYLQLVFGIRKWNSLFLWKRIIFQCNIRQEESSNLHLFPKKNSLTLSPLINIYIIFITYINFHLPSTKAITNLRSAKLLQNTFSEYVADIGGSLRVGKAGGTHALFFKERGPLPLLLFRLSGRGLGVTHRCSWGERWLDKYRDGRPGQKQIITRAGKRARWLAAVPASQDRSNLTLFSGRLSQFSEWLSHHESSGPDYGGELQGARHPAVLRCWFSSLLC